MLRSLVAIHALTPHHGGDGGDIIEVHVVPAGGGKGVQGRWEKGAWAMGSGMSGGWHEAQPCEGSIAIIPCILSPANPYTPSSVSPSPASP